MKTENLNRQIDWLLQEKYRGKMTSSAKRDVARLKRGEPVDYIIGHMEFLGCKIDLSKKPLIPRVETEFWAGEVIEEIKKQKLRDVGDLSILDIFAGSGCIGIAVLKHLPNSIVIFADFEKKSLEQIKINCKLNKIPKSRYQIFQSDIFKNIKGNFDYIFANPPYIPTKRINKVQKSVLAYEPREALFGGGDGFFYIKKFLAEAKNFLNPHGRIFMEFDSPQKKQIENLFTRQNFSKKKLGGQEKHGYKTWEFHKDQYGKWRYVVIE